MNRFHLNLPQSDFLALLIIFIYIFKLKEGFDDEHTLKNKISSLCKEKSFKMRGRENHSYF